MGGVEVSVMGWSSTLVNVSPCTHPLYVRNCHMYIKADVFLQAQLVLISCHTDHLHIHLPNPFIKPSLSSILSQPSCIGKQNLQHNSASPPTSAGVCSQSLVLVTGWVSSSSFLLLLPCLPFCLACKGVTANGWVSPVSSEEDASTNESVPIIWKSSSCAGTGASILPSCFLLFFSVSFLLFLSPDCPCAGVLARDASQVVSAEVGA